MQSRLTLAEIETLREMQRYGYYTFRQATARKLEAKGLCEVVHTHGKPLVRPVRRITDAGRAALAKEGK